jgi:hypothetical protein
MSAASGNNSSAPPVLKFVSETEIEEKRRKRQEEWEKVRQPDQPLEAPEEQVETRSLYEQLQAQKDLKQLEFEEQHKLKNQIHGLDEGEAEFLDYVNVRQQEVEKERELEELVVLQEFRNSVSSRTVPVESTSRPVAATDKPAVGKSLPKKRSSQAELLAGAVKRKRSNSNSSESKQLVSTSELDAVTDGIPTVESSPGIDAVSTSDQSTVEAPNDKSSSSLAVTSSNCSGAGGGVARVVGILPGLGVYTDSEQSDSSSSDSEIDTDIFRRDLPSKSGHETTASAVQRHR